MIILAAILGAFCNRARGGLISILFAPKDDASKYDWVGKYGNALAFGALCFFLTSSWWGFLAGLGGMLLGASFGWGAYIHAILEGEYLKDRKHIFFIDPIMKDDEYIRLRGIAALSLRGLVWTACIGIPLAFINPAFIYFIPVGLLMGLVYYIAGKWSYGEYAWGATLWASIVLI